MNNSSRSPNHVAIIGRGIAGLATAYRLVKAGYQVSVFGRPDSASTAASWAASGVSTAKGLNSAQSPVFDLKLRGHYNLPRWIREIEASSGKSIAHDFHGVSEPVVSDDDLKKLCTRVYRERPLDLFGTKIFDRTQLDEVAGTQTFGPEIQGALFYPQDGWVDPAELLGTLQIFLENTKVSFFDDEISRIVPLENKGLSLKCSRGSFDFEDVVLAAGIGMEKILSDSGLSVRGFGGVAGCTMLFSLPLPEKARAVTRKTTNLLIHDQKGRFGSTKAKTSKIDEEFLLSHAKILREQLQLMVGEGSKIGLSTLDSLQSGVRVRMKDRTPIMGYLRFPQCLNSRLHVLGGFYTNGFQFADLGAQGIVMSIQSGSMPAGFESFSPTRFLN